MHWTTDDAFSKKGTVVSENRCIGYGRKSGQRAAAFMGHACSIDIHHHANRSHYAAVGRPRLSKCLRMTVCCTIEIATRPANGAVSRRLASNQNVSFGEAPTTTAIVFVRGKHPQNILKKRLTSVELATTVSYSVSLSKSTRRCLHSREDHRGFGKQVFAVSLDEIRGRRADSHDQIGWLISIQGVKIIDEWTIRFVTIQPSSQ